MNYIDMHCDTLVKAVEQKKETAKKLEHTMVDAERLHRCGTKAQFFAMFLQQKKEENWSDPGHDPDDCRSEKRKISLWYNGAENRKADAGYVCSISEYDGKLCRYHCAGMHL